MTNAEILRYTWHLSHCPKCDGTPTDGPRCRSCWGRGFASLASFAKRDLGRSPRSIARMLSQKKPVSALILARCLAIIEEKQRLLAYNYLMSYTASLKTHTPKPHGVSY
jgi:hypothetical protein